MTKALLIMLAGMIAISLTGCGDSTSDEAEKEYADQVMEICLSYGLDDISIDLEWEGEELFNGKNWSGSLPPGASTVLDTMIPYQDGVEYYSVSVAEAK